PSREQLESVIMSGRVLRQMAFFFLVIFPWVFENSLFSSLRPLILRWFSINKSWVWFRVDMYHDTKNGNWFQKSIRHASIIGTMCGVKGKNSSNSSIYYTFERRYT